MAPESQENTGICKHGLNFTISEKCERIGTRIFPLARVAGQPHLAREEN
jgi:hypothetical protein